LLGGEILGHEEENKMRKVCNFCGSDRCEERRIEYLYSHEGEYLTRLLRYAWIAA
jgi:hypothetical protein